MTAQKGNGKKIVLLRGEIGIARSSCLYTSISTCVSICLYVPKYKIGGMTHVSSSKADDTTPSGRWLRQEGYFYADRAIEGLLALLEEECGPVKSKDVLAVVIGGQHNEGPVRESLAVIEMYPFTLVDIDVNQGLYRKVLYCVSDREIRIEKSAPFGAVEEEKTISFQQS